MKHLYSPDAHLQDNFRMQALQTPIWKGCVGHEDKAIVFCLYKISSVQLATDRRFTYDSTHRHTSTPNHPITIHDTRKIC